jgi:GntR family transcriptional regulator, phosphonate transport system regulatory protein
MLRMRRTGVIVWQSIASDIRREIETGTFPSGKRLPNEQALAERYGVNRHTVRQAVASLAEQGLVAIRQGRGMFINRDGIAYPLTSRTRFTETITKQNRTSEGRLIRVDRVPATTAAARDFGIQTGAMLLLLEVLYNVDGWPFSVCEHHFPLARFDGLEHAFEVERSITRALEHFGIADFSRRVTRIAARLPSAREAKLLRQARSQPLMVTEAVNVDPNGVAIELGIARISADRIQLVVDTASTRGLSDTSR